MNDDVKIAKQAVHDKLESQIKTAEAKLEMLKARAEAAKANLEIKAIAALLPKKDAIQQKLQELKNVGAERWEQAKTDLERRIAEFEKSVKALESKAKEIKAKAS
jgi:phage shock protein A